MSRLIRLVIIAGFAVLLINCPSTPKPPENAVAAPTFTPAEGTYQAPQTVTIATATEGAQIRYTVDSSEPTATTGTEYTGPVPVSATTTIRAIAVKKGMTDSPVASATFTISAEAAKQPGVEPITDDEVAAAQNALVRAKEVDADYYDPDNFDAARRLLDSALAQRTGDPAAARAQLTESKAKADLSFDNSVPLAARDLQARMDALKQKLLDLEADKYMPDDFQKATAGIDEAKGLFQGSDFAAARAKAWETLRALASLRDRMETRLADVKAAKYAAEQSMKEAESTNAYAYAPAQKGKVNELYLAGLQAQGNYKLDEAEESFGAANEAAKEVLRIAREARGAQQADEKAKAEAKQVQVMKALQEASQLTVVTEDGTVVQPKNWTQDELQQEIDQAQKEEQQKQDAAPGGQSMVIPSDGGTAVLADESVEDLLTQARQLWSLGLKENAAGNYTKAQDYFDEAQRYIDVYKSYAVQGVYTVRLIPERRDCLWRIAEYKDIYGDPLLWPKIWRRNRKMIQNPDLIYPGWQLVIPPR
jgi:nucleoid-associated protein YgaU